MSRQKGKTYCSRKPFASGDGCDRGSVNIHMFDELPYCKTISPTQPEIPPEVVPTPIDIAIPPSCTCVNVEFGFPVFKFHKERKFSASASFKARGDCCGGEYKTDFKLEIPCPVVGGAGENRISIGIAYGSGKGSATKVFAKRDDSACTIETEDVNMDLEIPCPVSGASGGDRKFSVGISYGKEFKSGSATFAKVNRKACEIAPQDASIKLNIPCPVIGRDSEKRISAEIRYGKSHARDSATFMKTNARDCTVEGKDVKLDLRIPCPLENIKFVGKGGIKAKSSYGESCTKVVELDFEGGNIDIPCPIAGDGGKKSIKVKVKVGNKEASDSGEFADVNKAGCTMSAENTSLSINVPCPFSLTGGKKMEIGFDTIKYDGMSGAFDTLSSIGGIGWTGLEISSCDIKISQKKVFRLRALPPTTRDRLVVTTECSTTADDEGSFDCSDSFDESACCRKLHFKVKFPASSAYGAFRLEGGRIRFCHFYAAHGIHTAASVDASSGSWYLNVDHSNFSNISGTVSKTEGQNDDNHTSVKLFVISGGRIIDDYRAMPFIPVYA